MSWGGVRGALEPLFKARGESARASSSTSKRRRERRAEGKRRRGELAKIFGGTWADYPRKDALRDFLPNALWQCRLWRGRNASASSSGPRRGAEARRGARRRQLVTDFGASRAQAGAGETAFPARMGAVFDQGAANAFCRNSKRACGSVTLHRLNRRKFEAGATRISRTASGRPAKFSIGCRAPRRKTCNTRELKSTRRLAPSAIRRWCACRTNCARSSTI